MKTALKLFSILGLGLTIVPAGLVFLNQIPWQTHANLMLIGTILWFVTAPFWMKKKVG